MAENVTIKIEVDASAGAKTVGELAKGIDNVTSSVDDSMKSLLDFRKEMKEIQVAMTAAGQAGDKAGFEKLKKRFTEVKDAAKSFREETIPLEDHIGVLAKGMGSAVSMGSNLALAFGADKKSAEELFKTFAKVQAIQGIVSGFSDMMDLAGKLPAALAAVSTSLRAMGASMYASLGPYGLLLAAIVAIGAAFAALIISTQDTDGAMNAFLDTTKTTRDEIGKLVDTIKDEVRVLKDLELQYDVITGKITESDAKIERSKRAQKAKEEKVLTDFNKKQTEIAKAYDAEKAELDKAMWGRYNEKVKKLQDVRTKTDAANEKSKNMLISVISAEGEQERLNIKAEADAKDLEARKAAGKRLSDAEKRRLEELRKLQQQSIQEDIDRINKSIEDKLRAEQTLQQKLRQLIIDNTEDKTKQLELFRQKEIQDIEASEGNEETKLAIINQINIKYAKLKGDIWDAYVKSEDERSKSEIEIAKKKKEELLKLDKERLDNQIKSAQQVVSLTMQSMDIIMQYQTQKNDEEISAAESKYKKEEELLKDKLDAGLINQAEYDSAVRGLEISRDREIKAAKEKQWNAEHEAALLQATLNGILAVMQGYAQTGPIGGSVLAVIMGAISAAQIAAIASQKMPEFAQGGYVPGIGNQDTVNAMLTPGEFVLKKDVVSQINSGQIIDYNKLASMINDKKVTIVSSEMSLQQGVDNKIKVRAQF